MGLISILNTNPVIFILIAIALIFALCIHEFAHGYIAYLNGDDTAYRMGRLTLNPLAHLDPIGSMMILFIGFGYAKPVPVNPANLNNPRIDMIKVAAAGPISNFILSFIGVLFFTLLMKFNLMQDNYRIFLTYFIIINTYLGLFNLIPIYPLDGGQIFGNIISKYNRRLFIQLNEYGPKILMGVILFSVFTNIPILSWFIQTPADLIISLFTIIINSFLFFI
tara:strand:- start:2838 stop:3503 length:666 start_codon:yes stop_codon:yes gene_type:complete